VSRPDDPAAGTELAKVLPGPVVRRAPRRRDHRGVHRDRHPPVGAGRDLLPPRRPARSDLDLQGREIRIRGKGRTARTVKIGHQAARSLDRYLRARARHPQSWRPQLWLGVNNRGPLTAGGIYQAVARRGRQAGVTVYPHRFRHHFSHTWLDRGGPPPQMLTRYGASARGARARRSYDRIMNDTT
jgi:integrase/recombinase XerD